MAKPISQEEFLELVDRLDHYLEQAEYSGQGSDSLEEIVDHEELLERVGGDLQLLQELVELFLEDYPELLQTMRRALVSYDFENFSIAAHALKGMAGTFSAKAAADAALKCELIGAQHSCNEAAESLSLLEREISRLHAVLKAATREYVS